MNSTQIRKTIETNIRLEKLDNLRPHEKTAFKAVDQLAQEIETDSIQKDPIIVERGSNVVLDGMHRLAALKKLSCKTALCYFVPYEEVTVDRWFRIFISNQDISSIELIESMQRLDKFNIKYKSDPQEAERFVRENKFAGALITKEKFILLTSKHEIKDLVEFYTHLSHIEILFLMHFDMRIKFSSRVELEGSDVVGVLIPPTLHKEDVLIATKGNVLFPLKSTKHIPQIRPLSVNLPISFLQDEKLEEKNRELKTFLKQKKTQLFSGGMEVDGREYEEAVLIYKVAD
jgi:hypothetical protein